LGKVQPVAAHLRQLFDAIPIEEHAALVVVLRWDDHVGIGDSQLPNVHDDLRDPRG
jgi:hypothetical protein